MAVQTLAEAALIVRPDFTGTEAETKAGARKAGKDAGDEAGKSYGKSVATAFAGVGKSAAQRFSQAFASSGTFKSIAASIGSRVATAGRSVASLTPSLKQVTSAVKETAAAFGRLGDRVAEKLPSLGQFAGALGGIAAKAGIAAGALGAAIPQVVGLGAALLPAAGAAVALPGALLASKVAIGVLKVAVDGVGDAITKGLTGTAKEAAKALEELPPGARRFAEAIIKSKDSIEKLKASISGRFFKPLNDEIEPLTSKYLPLLQRQAPDLAGALGGVGEAVAKAATKGTAVSGVRALFDNTTTAVVRLRGAVPGLITAFGAFTKASTSTLPGIADSIVRIANRFSTFVTEASKSGRVVEIFNNAKATLRDLGGIVGNVGGIFGAVFAAANDSGTNTLTTLRNLTGQARDFLASAEGNNTLTTVFETMAKIGDSLKTGLGAALPAVAESIRIASPLIATMADIVGRLVVSLAPLLPAFTGLAVELLTAVLPAVQGVTDWLGRNRGVIEALAPIVIGLVGAYKAYRIIVAASAAVTAVQTAAIAFGNTTLGIRIGAIALDTAAWIRSTAATVASTAAMVAQRVIMIASTAATWLAAAATTALGIAVQLATSPITLIIIAIGLLIAAVVYLYRNNETARKIIDGAWKAIKTAVKAVGDWFSNTLVPSIKRAIDQGVTAFNWIRDKATAAWKYIKDKINDNVTVIVGMFNNVKKFITETLPKAFETGVSAIKKAWDKVKEAAKVPVSFVVNSVINPLITGFNKVAGTFGVPKVSTIGGFAAGGQIPGPPSSRDNRVGWLKNQAGKTISNIEVATGEFIVNARDTAKALPLLRWINDGMRGGPADLQRRLGRPMTQYPGDGSEGYAFADGGLVGFFKDVWGVVSDPVGSIKKPFEAMLAKIPGGGTIKDFLTGMGKRLIGGFMDFITGQSGGAGGNIGAAQAFVKAQAGKPYGWANAGPGSYDCSGIVSAVYNVLKGRNPYSHTFSTGSLPGQWFDRSKKVGPLVAGWSHPGQRPASASVGHMAGMIAGLPFESTGSRGVRVGAAARKVTDFANVGVARANGGLVDIAKIARADFGQVVLERGHNLIYNGTGAPEPLKSPEMVDGKSRMHPDDIEKLATAIGGVLARALLGTVPATRVAARQAGRR